jgi:hypothetical protein
MLHFYETNTLDDLFRNSGWFDRPFKEVNGYEFRKLENGNGQILINALGVNPDDVELTVDASEVPNKQILKVSGKSELFDEKFQFNYAFTIKPVKSVQPSVKNGILALELEWNKPVAPDVEIKGFLK